MTSPSSHTIERTTTMIKLGAIEPRNMSVKQRKQHISRNFKLPKYLVAEINQADTELKRQFVATLSRMFKGKEEIDFQKLEEMKHRLQMERLAV